MKTERIGMTMSLVFGAVFLFLATIFIYLGLWPGLSCYTGGLILALLSLSYIKYKVYAKYIVPTLLISGATIAALGWWFLPPVTTLRSLSLATGTGVFSGGLGNLMMALVGERK
jgi:hypothetical protein